MATDEATIFTNARDEVDGCLKMGHVISLYEEVEKAIGFLMTHHTYPLRRYNSQNMDKYHRRRVKAGKKTRLEKEQNYAMYPTG